MILCMEGPSAVGKTTTCRALEEQMKAICIPEVNALFNRPSPEPQDWYFQRQVERWNMASSANASDKLIVLDGDPFQPLWYNWSYAYKGWQNLEYMQSFYRPLVESGRLSFPDRYILLNAKEEELRRRSAGDKTRSRRGLERHMCLIETMPRYFHALADLDPSLVIFIEAASVASNLECIQRLALSGQSPSVDALELFDGIIDWLEKNEA